MQLYDLAIEASNVASATTSLAGPTTVVGPRSGQVWPAAEARHGAGDGRPGTEQHRATGWPHQAWPVAEVHRSVQGYCGLPPFHATEYRTHGPVAASVMLGG